MTPLRQKMIEDMQLRGFAERTQQSYLTAISKLARYYQKSPDQIGEQELRTYFLYLKNEKKAAASTIRQVLSALKFLYQHTLHQPCPILDFVKPKGGKKLPVVLSRTEVQRILEQVKQPPYRVCLNTIYSCGLRLQEGVKLPVKAIDSQRMVVRLQGAKGQKDRYVPLPTRTLEQLRSYWQRHRHPDWLFPRQKAGLSETMCSSGVQRAFRAALKASGVEKAATVHTLRHSYATHLVEAGVPLQLVQRYLGHTSLLTTSIYVHMTPQVQQAAVEQINQLMADLP